MKSSYHGAMEVSTKAVLADGENAARGVGRILFSSEQSERFCQRRAFKSTYQKRESIFFVPQERTTAEEGQARNAFALPLFIGKDLDKRVGVYRLFS